MFLSKNKNGFYYIFYSKPNGKRTSISTKARHKSDALHFLTRFKSEIDLREKLKFTPIMLKAFKNRYLIYSEGVHSFNTTLTIETTFNKMVKYFGEIQLSELNYKVLSEYFEHRIQKSSIYAARKDLINLSAAFNKAIKDGYLIENPCKGFKRFKIPEKLPMFYSKTEFEQLINAIDNQDIKDIATFAVYTGLRQMELITLEWTQINFNERIVIIDNRNHLSKSKKIRSIPLNDKALEVLNNRGQKTNPIFTINNEVIEQKKFSKDFKKYILNANLNPKLNFHSLRHTFASWLVQASVSIYEVSKLLGHSDIKTTEIYAHIRREDLKRAVDLI